MLAANGRGSMQATGSPSTASGGNERVASDRARCKARSLLRRRRRALFFPKSVPNDIDARGGPLRGSRACRFGQGGFAVDLPGVRDAPGGIVDQALPTAIAENRKEKNGARGQVIAVMSLDPTHRRRRPDPDQHYQTEQGHETQADDERP